MRRWAMAWIVAVAATACFRETFEYTCDPGEKGCQCNGGLCLAGLECSQDHCVLPGCDLGSEFCNCDDGDCDASLVCWEGAACVPPDGSEGTAGSMSGAGESTAMSSDPTSTTITTTSDTSTESSASTTPSDTTGGECMPGSPCDGPMLECADYLWGMTEGTCYRLAAQALPATCDESGVCMPASAQDCPTVMGDEHVVCEPACIDMPELCDTFDPAATVDLASMCVEDAQTKLCGTYCFNGSGSSLVNQRCLFGICEQIEQFPCGAYACEDGACNTSCVDMSDCAMTLVCNDSECAAP